MAIHIALILDECALCPMVSFMGPYALNLVTNSKATTELLMLYTAKSCILNFTVPLTLQ